MRSITVFPLLLLTVSVVGAEPYGFGRVLTLGRHDKLTHQESLRVFTADTVGFVYYQQGRQLSGRLDDPASFTIIENGRTLTGHACRGDLREIAEAHGRGEDIYLQVEGNWRR